MTSIRAAWQRPGVWRLTAVLAGAALCALVALAAPGSIQTLRQRPPAAGRIHAELPSWAHLCAVDAPETDREPMSFCARVDGRVVASQTKSGSDETHLLVLADFHMLIVELPKGVRTPGWGSRIVAIGPVVRASDGERELVALLVRGA